MVDGVVRNRVPPADRAREERIGLNEVSGEEERPGHVLASQDCENALRSVRVATTVERQRNDVLSRLQPHELACDDRGRQGVNHASPGRRKPAARRRRVGTGSPAGCATSITAP